VFIEGQAQSTRHIVVQQHFHLPER
jgi:hypothetical protein